MKKIACLVLALAILSIPALVTGAEDAASGVALSYGYQDGLLQVSPPTGWEPNPRLAADNLVQGFFHPAGMEPGQDIPIWVLVERRERRTSRPFDSWMRDVLEAGVALDFVIQDSTTLETADGHLLRDFRFNSSPDGAIRGLTFLETPRGALLFRRQSMSPAIWEERREDVIALLTGLRFVAR